MAQQLTVPLYHVDAFTTEALKGNPAAVCLLPAAASSDGDARFSAANMQAVAAELNLSETAFIQVCASVIVCRGCVSRARTVVLPGSEASGDMIHAHHA